MREIDEAAGLFAELVGTPSDTARIRQLAAEMLPVFEAGGVHPDAVAALLLFRRAAEAEEVTVDLVDQIAASVRRAHSRV